MQTENAAQLIVNEVEAARLLGFSRKTVYTMRVTGKLPFIRVGKSIRYRVESLKRWCAEQEQCASANSK